MDFLTADVRALYRKYLLASLGSAMVVSIYSFVDTIAVGQAVGPMGTAAIAVLNPFFCVMIFLAILCGIGGAVLMSNAKGEGLEERGNAYFTTAAPIPATWRRKTSPDASSSLCAPSPKAPAATSIGTKAHAPWKSRQNKRKEKTDIVVCLFCVLVGSARV